MAITEAINSSAERSKVQILQVLKETIPLNKPLKALEIASGSGIHVGYFAEHLPNVTWQPSDYDPEDLPSLNAYKQKHANILQPIVIDIAEPLSLKNTKFDIILAINLIHISPWAATLGLFANAGQILQPQGDMILLKYLKYENNCRTANHLWCAQREWCS